MSIERANSFWEDNLRRASEDQLRKENRLFKALVEGRDSDLIVWWDEMWTKPVKDINGVVCPGIFSGVKWPEQRDYMSHSPIGKLLLQRACIVEQDSDEVAQAKWKAFLDRRKGVVEAPEGGQQ